MGRDAHGHVGQCLHGRLRPQWWIDRLETSRRRLARPSHPALFHGSRPPASVSSLSDDCRCDRVSRWRQIRRTGQRSRSQPHAARAAASHSPPLRSVDLGPGPPARAQNGSSVGPVSPVPGVRPLRRDSGWSARGPGPVGRPRLLSGWAREAGSGHRARPGGPKPIDGLGTQPGSQGRHGTGPGPGRGDSD